MGCKTEAGMGDDTILATNFKKMENISTYISQSSKLGHDYLISLSRIAPYTYIKWHKDLFNRQSILQLLHHLSSEQISLLNVFLPILSIKLLSLISSHLVLSCLSTSSRQALMNSFLPYYGNQNLWVFPPWYLTECMLSTVQLIERLISDCLWC